MFYLFLVSQPGKKKKEKDSMHKTRSAVSIDSEKLGATSSSGAPFSGIPESDSALNCDGSLKAS